MDRCPINLIFLCPQKELIEFLDKKYHKVLDVLTQENDQVEHEHLSLIFCLVIFNDLKNDRK